MRRSTLVVALCALAACNSANAADSDASGQVVAAAELPGVLVFKTAACGCCNGWVEHMRAAGYEVEARDVLDLATVKNDAGVPNDMASCHTAIIDGYVVEGHVPAEQIARLLAERPEVVGIAAPGMPMGSPGMEGPNAQPYEIRAFTADGSSTLFAEVDPR